MRHEREKLTFDHLTCVGCYIVAQNTYHGGLQLTIILDFYLKFVPYFLIHPTLC